MTREAVIDANEYSRRLAEALQASSGVGPADDAADAPEPADEPLAGAADAQPAGSGDRVVRAGECVSAIARQTGHFWKTLWQHPANASLADLRQRPNVLMAGDRITVPPLRRKAEPCQAEMRHRFRRRGEPSHLSLRILDQDVPRANEPFKLTIDGVGTLTGTTDSEGKLDVPIPGNARRGKLVVGVEPDVLEYDLDLGDLDPIETWKGVQTRLRNLGFDCDETGEYDQQTRDAMNAFRESLSLPPAEQLDPNTRTQLQAKHGS